MKNMKNKRGFTLAELMIVVVILAIVGGGIVTLFTKCASSQGTAEDEAKNYASELGLQIKGVSCATRDSDNDGYVSCTISHIENGNVQLMPVECAARYTMNSGCRSQKATIRRGLF